MSTALATGNETLKWFDAHFTYNCGLFARDVPLYSYLNDACFDRESSTYVGLLSFAAALQKGEKEGIYGSVAAEGHRPGILDVLRGIAAVDMKNKGFYSAFCDRLVLYRLLDILAWLHRRPDWSLFPETPTHSAPRVALNSKKLNPLSRNADISVEISKSASAVDSARSRENNALPSNAVSFANKMAWCAYNAAVSAKKHDNKAKLEAVYANMSRFIVFLSLALAGKLPTSENIRKLFKDIFLELSLPADDSLIASEIYSPMMLAIVSPCYLLYPINWASKGAAKVDLLRLSLATGPQKPRDLVQCETDILQTVHGIIMGNDLRCSIDDLLCRCQARFKNDERTEYRRWLVVEEVQTVQQIQVYPITMNAPALAVSTTPCPPLAFAPAAESSPSISAPLALAPTTSAPTTLSQSLPGGSDMATDKVPSLSPVSRSPSPPTPASLLTPIPMDVDQGDPSEAVDTALGELIDQMERPVLQPDSGVEPTGEDESTADESDNDSDYDKGVPPKRLKKQKRAESPSEEEGELDAPPPAKKIKAAVRPKAFKAKKALPKPAFSKTQLSWGPPTGWKPAKPTVISLANESTASATPEVIYVSDEDDFMDQNVKAKGTPLLERGTPAADSKHSAVPVRCFSAASQPGDDPLALESTVCSKWDADSIARIDASNCATWVEMQVDGRAVKVPRWLHPDYRLKPVTQGGSSFHVVSLDSCAHENARHVAKVQIDKVLVIKGQSEAYRQVNPVTLDSLAILGDVFSKRTMTDQMNRVTDNSDKAFRMGTLADLAAIMRDCANTAIVNSLANPMPNGSPVEPTLWREMAHDLLAFNETNGAAHFRNTTRDTGDYEWGTTGTQYSYSWPHVDANGLSTTSKIIRGQKIWWVGRKPGGTIVGSLDAADKFLDWDPLDKDKDDDTVWEGVLLEEGDEIFMPPMVEHAVLGASHSLVLGRHYVYFPTLCSTILGCLHTDVHGFMITNADHDDAVRETFGRFLYLIRNYMDKKVTHGELFRHFRIVEWLDVLTVALLINFNEVQPILDAELAQSSTNSVLWKKWDRRRKWGAVIRGCFEQEYVLLIDDEEQPSAAWRKFFKASLIHLIAVFIGYRRKFQGKAKFGKFEEYEHRAGNYLEALGDKWASAYEKHVKAIDGGPHMLLYLKWNSHKYGVKRAPLQESISSVSQ